MRAPAKTPADTLRPGVHDGVMPARPSQIPCVGAILLAVTFLAGCPAQPPELQEPVADEDAHTLPSVDALSPLDATTDQGLFTDRVAAMDGGATDAVTADVTPPDAVTPDVPLPDAARVEAGPPPDVRPACTPTRTMCNEALECGAIPNGCPGGAFRCGECGGGETWCAIGTSRWQTRVYNCTQGAQREHPEWFDPVMFRDTSSWLVLEAHARSYVAAVAQCSDGRGALAVPDRNALGNEVRVRATDDDVAENFIIRTYGTGRTAGRYTSACTPAMF